VFRDSRGVVHTVSSADPLADLPASAAGALARGLLVPVHGDLLEALERCDAMLTLLGEWQDAFFAALPPEVDLAEEERYAAAAGLSLAELAREYDEWDDDEAAELEEDDDETQGEPDLDVLDLDDPEALAPHRPDPRLDEAFVAELERELLLLPMRVRLEALIAAEELVSTWNDLLLDHEKCLGHLVLVHGTTPADLSHEALVDEHAALHAGAAGHASEAAR
jgi:hypothetical protein